MADKENQEATYSNSDCCESFFFTSANTKKLIELYGKYQPKVGSCEIKNMKKLFQVIARDLANFYKITIAAEKCENKWKVLERNYKKVVDNNSQTGRGTKVFEFETEMDDIFKKKKNMKPSVLLSSNTVVNANQEVLLHIPEVSSVENKDVHEENNPVYPPSMSTLINVAETPKRKRSMRATTNTYKKRNDILAGIRDDLKKYYADKLKIDQERLQISREKLEESKRKRVLLEKLINSTD